MHKYKRWFCAIRAFKPIYEDKSEKELFRAIQKREWHYQTAVAFIHNFSRYENKTNIAKNCSH